MVREEHLAQKLVQLWGDVDTMDVVSGFFIVNCRRAVTYELTLIGGPWLMFDHFISIQPWRADFQAEAEKVSLVAAWVRISRWPLDYHDKGILYVVVNQIGQVLRVDMDTMKRSKGRFTRMCVQLDLVKPLLPSIMFNGVETWIEYEGLQLICFKCGKYGHNLDHCTLQSATVCTASRQEDPNSFHIVNQMEVSNKKAPSYGGWMVVQRNWKGARHQAPDWKGRPSRNESNHDHAQSRGSRFNILIEENKEVLIPTVGANQVGAEIKDRSQGHIGPKVFTKAHKKSDQGEQKNEAQKQSHLSVPNPKAYLAAKNKMNLSGQRENKLNLVLLDSLSKNNIKVLVGPLRVLVQASLT